MFDRAVAGVFIKQEKTYESIGSGTFVFCDGEVYLVSAAHVFDELKLREKAPVLHVGATNKFYEFQEARMFVSNTEDVNGDRQKDKLDIGAMLLPDEFIDEVNGKFLMVTEDLIENKARAENLQFYQALGYPNARNDKLARKAIYKQQSQDAFLLRYSGDKKLSSEIKEEVFIDDFHVIMDFHPKKGFDDDGNKVSVGNVTGMSGGLIQGVLDYVTHASGMYPTYAAGILIQKTKKQDAIIGTKFSAVFEWLKLHKKNFSKFKIMSKSN